MDVDCRPGLFNVCRETLGNTLNPFCGGGRLVPINDDRVAGIPRPGYIVLFQQVVLSGDHPLTLTVEQSERMGTARFMPTRNSGCFVRNQGRLAQYEERDCGEFPTRGLGINAKVQITQATKLH